MKLSLSWLADWVDLPADWDARELARRLTNAGFEIEAVGVAASPFSGVVVARIVSAERHPQADKLQVCQVVTAESDVAGGAGVPLPIVCGAANARPGLVSALARIGAVLPNNLNIGAARLRGVASAGMLCSACELGLAENSDGIIELPADAPLGADLRAYLDLDDTILEINVTPNRGDAMSVLGIAREVAALSGAALKTPARLAAAAASASGEAIAVTLQPGAGAARLLARVLHGVDNTRPSPWWLRERLRRSGLRPISPVVDVTNYAMLELGQPMHAYDRARLRGSLSARHARAGERLRLIDGSELTLDAGALVIADDESAVGLAGVMGGERSAISAASTDIVFEAAWFKPAAIAGRARLHGLQTDASQRFERGVDWRGQERAMALATRLLLEIAGGAAGPVTIAELEDELPRIKPVQLRGRQLQRLLGVSVAAADVEQRLRALGMGVRPEKAGWSVQPPSWRFDIEIEPDLIEEVVRIGGLDSIEERAPVMAIVPRVPASGEVDERVVMRTLAARGYQEVITFGFVDPALQRQLFGLQPAIEQSALELANPIAADLAVMRTSLLPGLIAVARENLRRQQQRVRVFEIANRFVLGSAAGKGGGFREQKMLAGLALGSRLPEQWGVAATPVDFYDIKADLQALLALGGAAEEFSFQPAAAGHLHPGRAARIVCGGAGIGYLGELHPRLVRALELTYAPLLYEVDYLAAFRANLAQFREISRFPQIRRDISFTVPIDVAFATLSERVSVAAGSLLKQLSAFDVYQGKGVELGRKSIALGLILQDLSRTLTDDDADRVVQAVLQDLRSHLDARIRE
ncbi:MAG TPA: phenylalanine--tRNA ligase subunit beta [Steroidobacteraceae bacterium]|nr:phenylalanine--tRNA ligase subunit beta [Steroidobacteraceae bacterium]